MKLQDLVKILKNNIATQKTIWKDGTTIQSNSYKSLIYSVFNYKDTKGTIDETVNTSEVLTADDKVSIINAFKATSKAILNLQSYGSSTSSAKRVDTSVLLAPSLPCLKNMTQVFYNCTKLINVGNLDFSNVDTCTNIFYNCYSLTLLPTLTCTTPDKARPFNNTFRNCLMLKEIDISAFHNITTLANFATIDRLGTSGYPILRTNNLTTVTLPAISPNLTTVASAFYGCTNLTVLNNQKELFESCAQSLTNASGFIADTQIQQLTFARQMPNLRNLDSLCARNAIITEVIFPEELSNDVSFNITFYGCTSLEKVVNLSGKTFTGEIMPSSGGVHGTFYNCTNFKGDGTGHFSFYTPNTTHGNCLFYRNQNLTHLNVDLSNFYKTYLIDGTDISGITSNYAGGAMFSGCTNLIELNLTKYEPCLMRQAFYNCTSLQTITGLSFSNIWLNTDNAPVISEDLKKTVMSYIVSGIFNNCTSLTSCILLEGSKIYCNGIDARFCPFDEATLKNWIEALYDWADNPDNLDMGYYNVRTLRLHKNVISNLKTLMFNDTISYYDFAVSKGWSLSS